MTETELAYSRRLFDLKQVVHRPKVSSTSGDAADQRVAPVYVYDDPLILAINVALASRRPLLVRGPSGCGKSSLARNVADVLQWRYYEEVITSRTEARQLLWQVDLLRRLHDAQARDRPLGESFEPYIRPGILWWAFAPESAEWRGRPQPKGDPPLRDPWRGVRAERAVVLLDEIDKADPEVPNNLLVPLGSLYFEVDDLESTAVKAAESNAPLVIITTNDERDLPKAFLRRCVESKIGWPTRSRLIDIAAAHFTDAKRSDLQAVLEALVGAEKERADEPVEMSPAEFIDTVRAVRELRVKAKTGSKAWESLAGMTVWKHGRQPPHKS